MSIQPTQRKPPLEQITMRRQTLRSVFWKKPFPQNKFLIIITYNLLVKVMQVTFYPKILRVVFFARPQLCVHWRTISGFSSGK